MTNRRHVVRGVFESEEFNALLWRLPRAARRSLDRVGPDELGLIVEIVGGDDCTRSPCALTSHAPQTCRANCDASRPEPTDSWPDAAVRRARWKMPCIRTSALTRVLEARSWCARVASERP